MLTCIAMSKVINIYGHIAVFVITVNLGNIFNNLYPTLQRITSTILVFNCFTVYVVEAMESNTVYKTVKLLPQNTKCPTTT